jgi:3-oxoacyl-[acyl-carrier protein] reductase
VEPPTDIAADDRARPLSGRVALVTGAGSLEGIGFAIARRLAADGAAVALGATGPHVRERADELASTGATVVAFVADLRRREEVARAVGEVTGALGPVDILVNNAGMASRGDRYRNAPLVELDPDEWDRQLQTSLTSAFNVTRLVLPAMYERAWGRIVNVGSVTGPLVSYAGQSAYAAAKAGMDGLMRTAAIESAARGVTVNTVAPGWIETSGSSDEELEAGRETPTGRPGTSDEVAAAVAFLASPDASYITGHSLVVDGGNSVAEDHRRTKP